MNNPKTVTISVLMPECYLSVTNSVVSEHSVFCDVQ